MAEDIIIPVVVFATIFGIFYVWIITRNKERMALIEKGADASIFFSKKRNRNRNNTVLGVGIFMVGIALGILIGALLANYTMLPEGVSYSSIIFFGGLSLVIFHVIDKKHSEKEEQ